MWGGWLVANVEKYLLLENPNLENMLERVENQSHCSPIS